MDHAWDDKSYGCYVLLAKLTGATQYHQDAQRWLNWWTVGGTAHGADGTRVPYSPGGQAVLDQWGSLRYAANTPFARARLRRRHQRSDPHGALSRLRGAAKSTTRSARTRSAAASWSASARTRPATRTTAPRTARGRTASPSRPSAATSSTARWWAGRRRPDDQYTDDRSDFVMNEVATDYNAGFTAALARLRAEFGGAPLAGFPTPETPDGDEIFGEAAVNASGTNFTEIQLFLNNGRAGPPAWATGSRSATSSPSSPASRPADHRDRQLQPVHARLRRPPALRQHLLVGISCTGVKIYPGGQQHYRKEVQFRIASAGAWDPSNDWSFTGVATTPGSTPVRSRTSRSTTTASASSARSPAAATRSPRRRRRNLRVTGTTSTTVALAWNPSTDNVGVTGYLVFRGATQVGTSATPTFTDTGLAPNTTFTYTVRATDAAGNQSSPSNSVNATTGPPVPDTQPPTAPSNLAVAAKTSTTVSLAWTASTDNVGVTGYRIREGTTQVGTSTSTNFTVTGPRAVSTHSYNVVALDAAGNVSAASNTVTVTTDPTGTASLKVQYRAADTSATDQQIKPHLNIVNTGTTAVPLSELTVRYWYTRDGTQPQVYDCDFAVPGCANITAWFVTLAAPVATADTYLQLSFGAGAGTLNGGRRRRARSRTACTTRTGQLQRGERLLLRRDEDRVRRLEPRHPLSQRRARLGRRSRRHGPPDTSRRPRPGLVSARTDEHHHHALLDRRRPTTSAWPATASARARPSSARPTALTFTVTGLAPSTAHTYTVVAFDAAGNVSAPSQRRHRDDDRRTRHDAAHRPRTSASPATRPRPSRSPGTRPPTTSAWPATASARARPSSAHHGPTFTVTGLRRARRTRTRLVAFDAAGNVSPRQNAATATTTSTPDTSRPRRPPTSRSRRRQSTTVARLDRVDRQRRRDRVPRDGGHDPGRDEQATTFTVTGLAPSSTHTYTVDRGRRGRQRVAGQQRGDRDHGARDRLVAQGAVPRGRHERDRPADQAAPQHREHGDHRGASRRADRPLLVHARRHADAGLRLRLRVPGCANIAATSPRWRRRSRRGHVPAVAFGAGAGTLNAGGPDGRDPEPRAQPELEQLQRGGRLVVRPDQDRVRRLEPGHALPQRVLVWGVEPVPAGPDFSLAASPRSVSASQAGTAASTIAITRLTVHRRRDLQPADCRRARPRRSTPRPRRATAARSRSPRPRARRTAPPGHGDGHQRRARAHDNVSLAVTASQTPDFSLAASPASVSVQQGASAAARSRSRA